MLNINYKLKKRDTAGMISHPSPCRIPSLGYNINLINSFGLCDYGDIPFNMISVLGKSTEILENKLFILGITEHLIRN